MEMQGKITEIKSPNSNVMFTFRFALEGSNKELGLTHEAPFKARWSVLVVLVACLLLLAMVHIKKIIIKDDEPLCPEDPKAVWLVERLGRGGCVLVLD